MHAAVDRLASQYGINMHPTADAISSSPNIHVTRSDDGEVIDVVGDRDWLTGRPVVPDWL